ncbi:MAG: hypothetical protein RR500_09320 [Bacilli bacterium]
MGCIKVLDFDTSYFFSELLNLKKCDGYGYTIDTHVTKCNTTMDRVCIPIVQVDFYYSDHYGEKEKEKQKEKEKEKQKEKEKEKYREKDDCLNLET